MKQVDFYLISNRVNNAKYKLASRLANKLQRMTQRALLLTESSAETKELDTVMWSFSDTSFLAHEPADDAQPASLVQIGDHSLISPIVLQRNYDVLINLSAKVPEFSHHFSRIAEIVDADDDAKAAARKRYKAYQAEGFEMKTHNIEL